MNQRNILVIFRMIQMDKKRLNYMQSASFLLLNVQQNIFKD